MTGTRGETNGWFVVGASVVLFAASGYSAISNLWFIRSTVKTEGIVVSTRKDNIAAKGGEYIVYYPTVEFIDRKGKPHRIEASTGTRDAILVGTTLPILYPPGEPDNARVGGSLLWDWPLGLFLIGVFFLVFGCFLIVGSRWLASRGIPMRS